MIGFSEHVDLGDVGVLRDDPTIALRFEVGDLPEPPPTRLTLRLRGTAFDGYDGHAWSRTQRDVPRAGDRAPEIGETVSIFRAPDTAHDRVISFDLEPFDPPVLFLPPRAVALRVRPPRSFASSESLTIQRTSEDELRYAGSDTRGLRYEVYVASEEETLIERLPPSERARYLQLPADLPVRIGELAHRWTDGLPTNDAKALAIEQHLRREFAYDLHSPSSGTAQPVDHFLFESRRGHCEFFSTAMAVMLRTLGIPSRNVTGFVGGTWNRFGRYYAVRQGDAHSWVEAYSDDAVRPTWHTFDPTPAAGAQPLEPPDGAYYYVRDFIEALSQRWNTYVVGYDLHKQMRLVDDVSRRYERLRTRTGIDRGALDRVTRAPVMAALALVLVAAAYWMWRRTRPSGQKPADPAQSLAVTGSRADSAVVLFRGLESALRLHGITRSPSVPPLRHAEELQSQHHPLGDEVVSLTCVYLAARFGGVSLTDQDRRVFERRIRHIRALRRPAPRAA
jgi:transglutaminase-like putative cysteine protease